MKSLLKKYSTVLRFVLLFFGTYFLLSALYLLYLKAFSSQEFSSDYFTSLVAEQVNFLLQALKYDSFLGIPESGQGILLTIDSVFHIRIIEGCNAISVIILFLSFVFAFAQGVKKTIMFILAGMVLIYLVNIARIIILVIVLYKYPQYEKILHGVVFPGIIYGLVFLLWMVWVGMLKIERNEKV